MNTTTKFIDPFVMGKSGKGEGLERLAPPSWDCGWYWGFGYLQSKDIHHHIDTLNPNKNMFDALKGYYGDTLTIKDDADLWTFCELVQTFYTLKETAEVLGRGGSNYTRNPCDKIILNKEETKRINEIVLPAIFDELEDLLKKYR